MINLPDQSNANHTQPWKLQKKIKTHESERAATTTAQGAASQRLLRESAAASKGFTSHAHAPSGR